jgi:hypothetical protein
MAPVLEEPPWTLVGERVKEDIESSKTVRVAALRIVVSLAVI